MDTVLTHQATFASLTESERYYGIAPSQLKELNFTEDKVSKEMMGIFRQFFCGCRLAADKEEFKDACKTLLYKQETPDVVVKAINFALLSEMPTYRMLDINTSPLFLTNYKKKREFVYLNNFVISSNRAHFLHPSRSLELTSLLQKSKYSTLLSGYHFLGKEGMEVKRLQKQSLISPEKEPLYKEQIESLRKLFNKKKEILSRFPNDFQPGDFSFHMDPFYSNLLTKAYNYIESARAWPYFETNEKTLFLTDFLFLEPFQVLLSMVGHDKHRLGVVLDWLLRIKRTPWNELVKDYQDELEKSVGMMTRVKRYVPLDQ